MGTPLIGIVLVHFLTSDDMDAFIWRIGRGHRGFNAAKFALRKSGWRTWRDEVKLRRSAEVKKKGPGLIRGP